jgi:hypothetical protein
VAAQQILEVRDSASVRACRQIGDGCFFSEKTIDYGIAAIHATTL